MNSHPGLFSRVRQSKHFLMSRPCVSCPNNRIFFLTNCKLFLVVVFSHFQASSTRIRIFLKKGDFFVHCRKKTLPLFLDQTEARRAQKTFGDRAPLLISGSGWLPPPPPPLIWRSKSTTELAKHGGKLVSFSNEYVWAWPTKEIM